MTARRAWATEVRAVASLVATARTAPERTVVASALPVAFLAGVSDSLTLFRAALGVQRGVRLYVETQGAIRAAALVYLARRPEWVVLLLAARPDPGGADGAFRLTSHLAAAAARDGAHRIYAAVPDQPLSRETFFQAGFYSYTTETWYVAARPTGTRERPSRTVRPASSSNAHDLFRLYARTTPHAVQRAEQLSVPDFDLAHGAGAFSPPHLACGNPIAMRRGAILSVGDESGIDGVYVGFHGRGAHPHVCKVRTRQGDTDLARDLLRVGASSLDTSHALASPVRPYEEHVARALEAEGFRATAAAMLFVKELAVRVEEHALAPAVVR